MYVSSNQNKIIIIGGGQAGGTAALELRKYGCNQDITLVCSEHAAPYERPPLSKSYLSSNASTATALCDNWAQIGVSVVKGTTCSKIDRHKKLVLLNNGDTLSYEKLIIATGGAPRHLPEPLDENAIYFRTLDDANALRSQSAQKKRVLIIGGGVIGLEVASTMRRLGHICEVVEAAYRLMVRNAPPDIAVDVENLHKKNGVTLNLEAEVTHLQRLNNGFQAKLRDGRMVECDIVLAGIGITPNDQIAEKAGLAVENGIIVDECYRTSDPDIFAVGDVAAPPPLYGTGHQRIETWSHANESAAIAAAVIAGAPPPKRRAPWFWTDQFGVNIQIAGWPALAEHTVKRRSAPEKNTTLYYAGERLVAAATINAGSDMSALRRMLDNGLSPSIQDAENISLNMRALLKNARPFLT